MSVSEVPVSLWRRDAAQVNGNRKESFMVVHKRLTSKVEKDVQSIGRTLQRLGGKLLGDARAAAFDATERTLATAQKRLQTVRTNLRGPTA